jgi:hypothetical protein
MAIAVDAAEIAVAERDRLRRALGEESAVTAFLARDAQRPASRAFEQA